MPNYYPGSFNADRRNPRDSRYRDMADDVPAPAPSGLRTMVAKYRSTCVATGRQINPGDTITYQKGVGSTLVTSTAAPAPEGKYISHVFRTSGGTFYRNRNGRCEDAPCCGCCTI